MIEYFIIRQQKKKQGVGCFQHILWPRWRAWEAAIFVSRPFAVDFSLYEVVIALSLCFPRELSLNLWDSTVQLDVQKWKKGLRTFNIGWCLANSSSPFYLFIYYGMDGEIIVTSNFVKEKEAASYSKAAATLMFVLSFILIFCSISDCSTPKLECNKNINNF